MLPARVKERKLPRIPSSVGEVGASANQCSHHVKREGSQLSASAVRPCVHPGFITEASFPFFPTQLI